jgi:NTP pyrophosphatase (non-canonical NTP hydrolase)
MTRPEDKEELDIAEIQQRLREFAEARDWQQFHSPKNLAIGLSVECGELLQVFQWLTEAESTDLSDEDRDQVLEEVADVLIYLIRLADILGLSLPDALEAKIQVNEKRYPVALSRGNARKYSRRVDE